MIQKVKITNKPFPTSGEYAYIPEGDLRRLLIPLEKCILLKDNPRINDVASRELAVLIRENGFRKPIVLNEQYEVKAGNTAVKACRLLGMKNIPGVRSNWFTEESEWNYVLSDNRAGEYAEWDNKILARLMSIGKVIPESEGHGFTERELFKISNFSDLKYREKEETSSKTLKFTKEEILEDLFKEFRSKGFPFPEISIAECKQQINILADLSSEKCLQSVIGYRVADTYHKHRWDSSAQGMKSPIESFNNDISLKKAIFMQFEATPNNLKYKHFGFLNLVNGTQACSNFRPAFAKMLYNEYAPKNGMIFDPSTGYGGRLVGFLASHCKGYMGVDPSYMTCEANNKIINDLLPAGQMAKITMSPIEDLQIRNTALEVYCDFAFTSPPYFAKEKYDSAPNQSWRRYTDYEKWKLGFLSQLFKKVSEALKPGSLFLLNIEDVKIRERIYPLVEDALQIGKKSGFTYQETKYFELADRTKKTKEGDIESIPAKESILFFVKGGKRKIQKIRSIEEKEGDLPF